MDLTGRKLGNYQVAEEISRGGMGIVYRATDTRLNRDVALKVLPDDLTHDPERRRRFLQEAQAASALEHPHIAVIHEADEIDGHAFIAMELIRGEKLSELLLRQRLTAARALEIAQEVAAGLARAHDKGIVHRDLKPANVMITDEGHAKIIDFGIAKLIETAVAGDVPTKTSEGTDAGVVLGTMTYMSPEQARGDRVDHRSDIFSFGIVLHEMLAGSPPFQGKSGIETASAIIHSPSPRLPALGPAVMPEASADIQRIVDKCLEKDPADRYQGMKDVGVDLKSARRRLESTTSTQPVAATPTRGIPTSAIVAATVLVIVAGGAMWYTRARSTPAATDSVDVKSSSKPTVAVLYFDNTSGEKDLDWLRTGITEMVVTDLSQSQSLEVVGTDRLYGILAEMRRADDKTMSPEVVREIAQRTGVDNVIVGSYMKSGDAVRINLRLQEAGSGKIITSERVEGPNASSLFAMVDDLSKRIRTRFETLRAGGVTEAPNLLAKPGATPSDGLDHGLGDVTTSSIDAYKAYAEGINLHNRYRETEAAAQFEKAIVIDPAFAMAYVKLAVAQNNMGHIDLSDKYAGLALKNSARLTPRERFYIEGYYYSKQNATLARGLDAYRKCLDLDAGHEACRHNLALGLASIERDAEAAQNYEELIRRGTTNPTTYSNLAGSYWRLGEMDKALAVTQAFSKRNEESAGGHRGVGAALLALGQYEQALQEFDRAELLDPTDQTLAVGRSIAQILREDWAGAKSTADKFAASPDPTRRWNSALIMAGIALHRGQAGAALSFTDRIIAAYKVPGLRTAVGHRYAATALDARGDYARAATEAQRAADDTKGLREEPVFVSIAAVAFAKAGRDREAEAAMSNLAALAIPLTQVTVDRSLSSARGRIALDKKQYAAAITELKKAEATLLPGVGTPLTPPDHVGVWFSLGESYLGGGQGAAAEPYFQKIVTHPYARVYWPVAHERSLYYLGRIREGAGDMTKAREYYRRFLDYWKDGDIDRDRVAEAERKMRGQS